MRAQHQAAALWRRAAATAAGIEAGLDAERAGQTAAPGEFAAYRVEAAALAADRAVDRRPDGQAAAGREVDEVAGADQAEPLATGQRDAFEADARVCRSGLEAIVRRRSGRARCGDAEAGEQQRGASGLARPLGRCRTGIEGRTARRADAERRRAGVSPAGVCPRERLTAGCRSS